MFLSFTPCYIKDPEDDEDLTESKKVLLSKLKDDWGRYRTCTGKDIENTEDIQKFWNAWYAKLGLQYHNEYHTSS